MKKKNKNTPMYVFGFWLIVLIATAKGFIPEGIFQGLLTVMVIAYFVVSAIT